MDSPLLSADPVVRPTPLSALEQDAIPTELHFRRDHFAQPALDAATWALEIGGAVERPLRLSLDDLERLPPHSLDVVLECAGHRRAEFEPPAQGVAWALGAVAEARWSGVSLRDVLKLARPRPGITAAVLAGADRGRFEAHPDEVAFARAVPIDKALDGDTLLAWEMNGEPLPAAHGAPLRAVVPGWYATDSVKWLVSIELVAEPFDGPYEAIDYRLPDPETGGTRRMTQMPVHAIVTTPSDGGTIGSGSQRVRGIAWGGCGGVARVEVSIDGAEWVSAGLTQERGRYARTHWELGWTAAPGMHTLAIRATDGAGLAQPDEVAWNARGYGNARVHRITVTVAR